MTNAELQEYPLEFEFQESESAFTELNMRIKMKRLKKFAVKRRKAAKECSDARN